VALLGENRRDAGLGTLIEEKPHTRCWRAAAVSSWLGTSVLA
jgi:hypothetical protein